MFAILNSGRDLIFDDSFVTKNEWYDFGGPLAGLQPNCNKYVLLEPTNRLAKLDKDTVCILAEVNNWCNELILLRYYKNWFRVESRKRLLEL